MTSPHKTVLFGEDGVIDCTPTYLFDHAELYREDPLDAGVTWFAEAHYGLGVTFGLHSLMGQGTDALANGKVTLESYRKLKDGFNAKAFNAVDLVEYVIANGMRYIEMNVRGDDGFCLFNTKTTDFNSATSPAHRDLLAELASVCEYHGVGLCLEYSLGRHLMHPHAPGSLTPVEKASPAEYFDFTAQQIHELMTQYGPVAGICLDGVEHVRGLGQDDFDPSAFYRMIHSLQPQTLLSFQNGLTGEEDFFRFNDDMPEKGTPDAGFAHRQMNKPVQVRLPMTPGNLGYAPEHSGKHLKQEHVWKALENAAEKQHNLLLNTALLPDGSLDLEDLDTLVAVGERLEKQGFPRG